MPVAVVTGANRGLGFETAHSLARLGYRVWLTGRDLSSVTQAAAHLSSERLDVQLAVLDVTAPASIEAFAQRMSTEPSIAALVNNAGSSLDGFDANVAAATLDNNYRGAARVTNALFGKLASDANIVMVSSEIGRAHV